MNSRLINYLIDEVSNIRVVRSLLRYTTNRMDGLQYGSYDLESEVALALSIVKNSRGGGW